VDIYRFTVTCIDQRDVMCLHSLTQRHIWSFGAMFGVCVRFKWKYV